MDLILVKDYVYETYGIEDLEYDTFCHDTGVFHEIETIYFEWKDKGERKYMTITGNDVLGWYRLKERKTKIHKIKNKLCIH
jgi:hypothetical protein